jgi:hypothetical protein
VHWSSDVGAAEWIAKRLHPFAADVGSVVPTGFPAYARILHPGWRTERGQRVKVRWGEPARAAPDAEEPRIGSLEPDELDALVELLAAFTHAPRSCWFAVWDGYGWMQGPPAIAHLGRARDRPGPPAPPVPAGPRLELPGRSLALYEGPIEDAAALAGFPTSQSPNLWWPDDRSWCVASDIDLTSTYVGGVAGLVECLLRDKRLEVLPARVTDPIAG